MGSNEILVGFIGGVRLTGDLVALSKTGIVIRCSEDVKPGTIGLMGISAGCDIIRMVAVVRRRIPGLGLHFKFVKMSATDRQLLRRLLLRIVNTPSG